MGLLIKGQSDVISVFQMFYTMEVNKCLVISKSIFESKVLYTKPRRSILRRKMVLLNGKVGIF